MLPNFWVTQDIGAVPNDTWKWHYRGGGAEQLNCEPTGALELFGEGTVYEHQLTSPELGKVWPKLWLNFGSMPNPIAD